MNRLYLDVEGLQIGLEEGGWERKFSLGQSGECSGKAEGENTLLDGSPRMVLGRQ